MSLKRLFPQSLAGQMITLLLLALVASYAISALIFEDERRSSVRDAMRLEVIGRVAATAQLIADTPREDQRRIVRRASSRRLGYWISPQSVFDSNNDLWAATRRDAELQQHLSELLDGSVREVQVRVTGNPRQFGWLLRHRDPERQRRILDRLPRELHDHARHFRDRRGERRGLGLIASLQLSEGRWLNAATLVPSGTPPWRWPALVSMALLALFVILIVILMARRIARPLTRLAGAADQLGRGEEVQALPEVGPSELRRTTRAFNAMGQRLRRFVEDRTRLLAAVSHDLRTPITTLRLRAEFVEDPEVRAKLLATVEEMERITEGTLAFAREEAVAEDTRQVDLAALIDSLCQDLRDLGHEVIFTESDKLPYPCRPVALKRALRNLIENAVHYGDRARVVLQQSADILTIMVDDDGPGIPEADFEKVFAPFARLEESRNRETGGIGLGMAIARSVIRSHGGDIRLSNRQPRGLRVTVTLPNI